LDHQGLAGYQNSLEVMEPLDKDKFDKTLYKTLYQFSPEERSIFLLRFHEELSVKEIAGIMECPEGTVKSRLHYTAKKLARTLQAYNPEQNIEIRT